MAEGPLRRSKYVLPFPDGVGPLPKPRPSAPQAKDLRIVSSVKRKNRFAARSAANKKKIAWKHASCAAAQIVSREPGQSSITKFCSNRGQRPLQDRIGPGIDAPEGALDQADEDSYCEDVVVGEDVVPLDWAEAYITEIKAKVAAGQFGSLRNPLIRFANPFCELLGGGVRVEGRNQ